jgi:hypothetical protein
MLIVVSRPSFDELIRPQPDAEEPCALLPQVALPST